MFDSRNLCSLISIRFKIESVRDFLSSDSLTRICSSGRVEAKLLQRYNPLNPGVDFNQGSGLVFIPRKGPGLVWIDHVGVGLLVA
ncbi:receptor-like protein kinase [Sesbania bispinosa]|nr:receptor-like protein kinase [Sesbania bispinosa]